MSLPLMKIYFEDFSNKHFVVMLLKLIYINKNDLEI